MKVKRDFSWQAQYLVSLFVAGAVSILGGGPVSLFDAGAVLVKFGKIAGARNVVFFNAKWSS